MPKRIIRLFILIITFLVVSIKGQTFWSPTGNLSPSGDDWVPAIACNTTGTLLAQSHGIGIFRSTNDGDEWNLVLPTNQVISDITISPDGKIFAICNNTNDIYIRLSTDDGLTWNQVYSAQHTDNYFSGSGMVFMDSNTAVAVISFTLGPTIGDIGVEIVRSTNGGLSWQLLGISDGWGGAEDLIKLNDGRILVTTTLSGISYSSDNGSTWHFLSSFPVYSMTKIKTNSSGNIFVGRNTAAASGELLYRSTDNGNSWQPTGILGGSSGGDVQAIYIDYDDRIYVSFNQGASALLLYRSMDNGESWQELTSGLPPSELVYSLTGNMQNIIFAGTGSSGVYKGSEPVPVELTYFTAETAKDKVILSWQTATEKNNGGFEIEKQAFNVWQNIGFVKGHGTTTETNDYSFIDKNVNSGIYSYRLIQIDLDGARIESKEVNAEVNFNSGNFSLEQNYPNPFNPSTSIEYSIPTSGFVTIRIFNELGEEVRKAVNEYKQAGNYKINFNAEDIVSGVYYYRIDSGSYSATRKMILMK